MYFDIPWNSKLLIFLKKYLSNLKYYVFGVDFGVLDSSLGPWPKTRHTCQVGCSNKYSKRPRLNFTFLTGCIKQPCGGCWTSGQYGRSKHGPTECQPPNCSAFGKIFKSIFLGLVFVDISPVKVSLEVTQFQSCILNYYHLQ